MSSPLRQATLVPRPAHRRQQQQGHEVTKTLAYQTGNAVTEPDVPPSRDTATRIADDEFAAKLLPTLLTTLRHIS